MSTNTTVSWDYENLPFTYVLHWRRTDSSTWERERIIDPQMKDSGCFIVLTENRTRSEESWSYACKVVLRGIRVDDWVFGVSSVSKDGYESPVASAVPGGAFRPWVKPAEQKK